MSDQAIEWGPTGQVVYERTYSRTKPDGTKETWPETVERVCRGNLELVYGPAHNWPAPVFEEYDELRDYMERFAILPAGRHLWASGVKGRQYLFNCHVAGWGERLSDHFEFSFLRLMEGGGVGANYSSRYLQPFGAPRRQLKVHIVCDPMHQDYEEMRAAGLLSTEYDSDWAGSFNVEDSREGWAAALVDLIDTFMTDDEVLHENRVYDVSRVRCKGSRLKTFGGVASGPGPFAKMMHEVARVLNGATERSHWMYRPHLTPVEAMEIDHAIAECVVSGGNRRSARMAICHADDPYINDFLACKRDAGKHWTTNISVEIDDAFLQALTDPHDNTAKDVHRKVIEGMLRNGEPGYWNSSVSNDHEINPIVATNPCGEIPLPEWGACVLGHVNLDAFAPKAKGDTPDWGGMVRAHRLMARFLLRATFGDMNDPKQVEVMRSERRIGVGHLGVQAYLAKCGLRYSDAAMDAQTCFMLSDLADEVRDEARQYAFQLRVPEPVKTTAVAPTGSIAKLPGVSEGIHPIYARHFIRRVRFSMTDADQRAKVSEFAAQGLHVETDRYDQSGNTMVVEFPTKELLVAEVEAMGYPADIVESADEISLDDMLSFQAMYQQFYADNAVSFTVNVRPGMNPEEVADTIAKHLPQVKGTTVMVDNTRPQAPYERISEDDYELYQYRLIADGTDEDCAKGACPVR